MEDNNIDIDETEQILANLYLDEKLTEARMNMEEGKGAKISLNDLWE